MITHKGTFDELREAHPEIVRFLIQHDLPCVVCGEPFWGTLEDLVRQKNWDDARIDALVEEFNASLKEE